MLINKKLLCVWVVIKKQKLKWMKIHKQKDAEEQEAEDAEVEKCVRYSYELHRAQ